MAKGNDGGGDLELRGSRRTPRRRGGGTLLGGFVWTRVDAADARIPPLSVFSGGAKCQS